MKNALFLLLMILCAAAGCKAPDTRFKHWMGENGKIKILSTTSQVGDLVQAVGGERIDSLVLIPSDLNPHAYELVKGDGEKLARADWIFFSGLGLEHGASLSSLLQKSHKATAVSDWIAEHYPDRILYNGRTVDPHLWMDVSLWEKAIDPIQDALCALDPEGSEYFAMRADLFRREMAQVDQEVDFQIHAVPREKRYLVTSHDAFRYFARRYLAEAGELHWEERFAAPEGLAPDGQLNPADLQQILLFLKQKEITVLFPESNVNRDSICKIASAGVELGVPLSLCDAPLYGDTTNGLPYLDAMRQNAHTLSTHLR